MINLESLLYLSAKLNDTFDTNLILNLSVLSLMGKLKITRAIALTPDESLNLYNIIINKTSSNISDFEFFHIDSFRELDSTHETEQNILSLGLKYCLPSFYNNNLIALFCLGEKITREPLSEEEVHYAKLLSTIVANALQHANSHKTMLIEKNNVESRNQLLATMFEVSRDFSVLLSKEQILKMLSYHLMGQLMVSRYAVYLYDKKGELVPIVNRFESSANVDIVHKLKKIHKIYCCDDSLLEEDINSYFNKIQACIISPMKIQGIMKGFLIVGKKLNIEGFTDENKQFIEILGNTSIAALENERLFHEELEKKRLEDELNIALEIQTNLLPKENPNIPNYSIYGTSLPSRQVGGDYFDFIKLDDERLLITIADVSGKGMPAALLMANVQAALRVLAPLNLPIQDLIIRLNQVIYQNTTIDKFVTMFLGILNFKENTFEYVNAGHNPPYLINKEKEIYELNKGGLILGVMEDFTNYSKETVVLKSGEMIFFFTDGVTEAMNAKKQEFSDDTLKELIKKTYLNDAKEIVENVISEVRIFAGKADQSDDITALAVVLN